MNKGVKRLLNVITTIAVCIVVLVAILLVGVRVIGWEPLMVLSGSMEPKYPTGSILYVKDVNPRDLQRNDVITFMIGNDKTSDPEDYLLATHRIVDIIPDDEDPTVLRFKTKGDNNQDVDGGLVRAENVVGTPIFHIPYLGYVSNYVQNPPGMYIAIAAGAVLILLCFLPDFFSDDKGKGKEKKNEKKKADAEEVNTEANAEETVAESAAADTPSPEEEGEDTKQG